MNRTGYKQLNERERERIAVGLACGESCRTLGRLLGRSASTISRERWRNGGAEGYVGCEAQEKAQRRAHQGRRPRKLRAVVDNWLRGMVLCLLRRRLSPEQISAELKRRYPDEPERWVSHQTIYTSIGILPRGELKREVLSLLRHQGKRRQELADAPSSRGWIHQLIDERPAEAEARRVPGHFEGDLLIGKAKSPAAVGVLLERVSRRLWLTKLERRDAYSAYQAFAKKLKRIEPQVRKTLTYDQGSEMAEHDRLTRKLDIQVYFCDPHSPWQRAGCENTNGLLRQYLPKGEDFSDLTQATLDKIAFQMNERPRKTLSWATPNEVWRKLLQGKSFEQAVEESIAEAVALGT